MSLSDQYLRRERYNRSSGSRRIDIDLTSADSEVDRVPVTYRALEKICLIVPAQYTFTIYPNKRHVNLHRPEKRPVREVSRSQDTTSHHESRNEAYAHSSRRQREFQEREAQLSEQQRRLERELEAVEQKEMQERIGIRERRPYSGGALSDQASTVIPKDASRPILTRRVTFSEREPASPTSYRYQYCDDLDSRFRLRYRLREDPVSPQAATKSRSRNCHIQEICPPIASKTDDRQPIRQAVRRYRCYKGVPFLFQRIVTKGRREGTSDKRVHEAPERSRRIRSLDILYESRAPDDYV